MRRIDLLAPFSAPHRERVELHRMLVSFAELGGAATVASWLDESARLRVVIGSLVTMRASGIFAENRLLNVCSAAEGFHRSTVGGSLMDRALFKALKRRAKKCLPYDWHRWLDNGLGHANDPSLRQRLQHLADQLQPAIAPMIGDAALWARVVSKCRNDLTHLETDREQYDGGDLYWLAEGVFNVTRLCLLMHVGLDASRLPTIASAWPITSSTDRIREAVDRLVGQLRR